MRGLGGTGKECSELGHWLQEDKVCPFILPVHLLRLQMLLLCKPVRFQHASQREMNHAQQSDSDSLSLSLSISLSLSPSLSLSLFSSLSLPLSPPLSPSLSLSFSFSLPPSLLPSQDAFQHTCTPKCRPTRSSTHLCMCGWVALSGDPRSYSNS